MARFIFIKGTNFFLTPSDSLSINETNLLEDTIFSDRGIYYEIERVSFDSASKCLKVKVVNYSPSDVSSFSSQVLKDYVLRIEFTELEQKYLEKDLRSYRTALWQMSDVFKVEQKSETDFNNSPFGIPEKVHKPFNLSYYLEPIISKTPIEFKVRFKNAHFKQGFVSFSYKPESYNLPIEFRIENAFIIHEFDNIKSYFPKAFRGQKYFNVQAILTLTDHVVTNTEATSIEIEQINEALIETITSERVYQLKSKVVNASSNKILFTESDMFNDGNILNQSGHTLLKSLYNHPKTRNRKQLEYLSGHKHSPGQKIRFTLGSNFGFLFFIEGKNKYHYCWELLDSHATYLWTLNKEEIENRYKRIEREIRKIYSIGREQYIAEYKKRVIEANLTFDRIEHQDINSSEVDGFIIWKQKLENLLL